MLSPASIYFHMVGNFSYLVRYCCAQSYQQFFCMCRWRSFPYSNKYLIVGTRQLMVSSIVQIWTPIGRIALTPTRPLLRSKESTFDPIIWKKPKRIKSKRLFFSTSVSSIHKEKRRSRKEMRGRRWWKLFCILHHKMPLSLFFDRSDELRCQQCMQFCTLPGGSALSWNICLLAQIVVVIIFLSHFTLF